MDDTSEVCVDDAFESLKEWTFKEMGSMKKQLEECEKNLRECRGEMTEIRGQMVQMNQQLAQVVNDTKERMTGNTVRKEVLKLLDNLKDMINAQLGKGGDHPAAMQPPQETVTVVEGVYDLDPEWQERLEPFVTRVKQTDLMNEVQLAFFHWFVKVKAKGGNATVDLCREMAALGAKLRLWPSATWVPENCLSSDLATYLRTKWKNTTTANKRRSLTTLKRKSLDLTEQYAAFLTKTPGTWTKPRGGRPIQRLLGR
ncbi:uncharacterized protein LOC124260493 [Haliotis rubra]|uniref:uncharacterized protein LOC124260493 n=1 Tax=Haliotis rubra TaxID=36100 RepID=UPI001EE5F966|nr:uncharacterized protein LOC124260493 [Haliotis rubra]